MKNEFGKIVAILLFPRQEKNSFQTKSVLTWLQEDYYEQETEYPRLMLGQSNYC